jgi:hypothetical protein
MKPVQQKNKADISAKIELANRFFYYLEDDHMNRKLYSELMSRDIASLCASHVSGIVKESHFVV